MTGREGSSEFSGEESSERRGVLRLIGAGICLRSVFEPMANEDLTDEEFSLMEGDFDKLVLEEDELGNAIRVRLSCKVEGCSAALTLSKTNTGWPIDPSGVAEGPATIDDCIIMD